MKVHNTLRSLSLNSHFIYQSLYQNETDQIKKSRHNSFQKN